MTNTEKWQRYVASKPPEWYVWRGIKKRCYYAKHPWYAFYGGKGIAVCDSWRIHGKGFPNFYRDMGSRPTPDYDLDRIDSSKGYCKENCRWRLKWDNRAVNRKEEVKADISGRELPPEDALAPTDEDAVTPSPGPPPAPPPCWLAILAGVGICLGSVVALLWLFLRCIPRNLISLWRQKREGTK